MSQLIFNDKPYCRPVQLLLVGREAGAWPKTYHLLNAVQESISTNNLSYSQSGSRRYQQSSFVSNGSYFCSSRGTTGVNQNRAGCTGRLFSGRPATAFKGLEARNIMLGIVMFCFRTP